MLTPRENLLKVFRHEMPERIPIVGHVDPYNQPSREGMDPKLVEALGEVKWCDEGTIIFSRYLGIDIMDYMNPPLRITRCSVTAESRKDGNDTITTWHTPAGELREVRQNNPDGGLSYLVEHLVKGPDDLPALAAMYEDETIELDPEGVKRIRDRAALIGDDGMFMFVMPGTPLGMLYRIHASVETLAYLSVDAPDSLRDLFAVMEANHTRRFHLAAQLDVDALVGMDDTSTTVISPTMFETYDIEYTNRMADIVHEAGVFYFHHSCGLIRNLLDLYRQTRMDAVHSFTIPPIGDVTIAEGRRKLGDKISIIAGAAPLSGNMDDRTAAADTIREMFEGAGEGDRFVVGIAAYPDKTMEQTQFIVDECRKYQNVLNPDLKARI